MFCPRCGVQSEGTRFCRQCGTELERVADALRRGDTASAPATRSAAPVFAIFNHCLISNADSDLDGRSAFSLFGHVKVDLTARPLPPGETHLSLSTIFGNIRLYVPEDVGIKVTGLLVFGDVKLRGQRERIRSHGSSEFMTPGYSQAARKLHLDVTAIFGNVRIKA